MPVRGNGAGIGQQGIVTVHDAFGFTGGAGGERKIDSGIGIRGSLSCGVRTGTCRNEMIERRSAGILPAEWFQGIVPGDKRQTRRFGINVALIRPRTIALLTDQYGGLKTIQYLHDLRNRMIPV